MLEEVELRYPIPGSTFGWKLALLLAQSGPGTQVVLAAYHVDQEHFGCNFLIMSFCIGHRWVGMRH